MNIDLDARDLREACDEHGESELYITCPEHMEAGVYAVFVKSSSHVRFQCRECQRWLMNVAVAETAS